MKWNGDRDNMAICLCFSFTNERTNKQTIIDARTSIYDHLNGISAFLLLWADFSMQIYLILCIVNNENDLNCDWFAGDIIKLQIINSSMSKWIYFMWYCSFRISFPARSQSPSFNEMCCSLLRKKTWHTIRCSLACHVPSARTYTQTRFIWRYSNSCSKLK